MIEQLSVSINRRHFSGLEVAFYGYIMSIQSRGVVPNANWLISEFP